MRLPSLFPALTLGATLSVTLFSGSMLKPASAANFLVTNLTDATDGACTADNCSLREALDSANVAPSADVISFEPSLFTSRQTLTVSQPYNVQDAGGLTINGPGAGLLTISGGNASRIFSVRLKATLALSGVTLTEGNGKG
ncbi:CSLREA domain-containing protein, partial [bacterium]